MFMAQNQAYLFLVFSLTGVAIGILFDFFRILRRTIKTSNFITYIEDILFWILTGVIILFTIFTFTTGEVRFYMILTMLFACFIYFITISKYIIKINTKILCFFKSIINFLLTPLKKIKKILKK